ncbi:PhoH family protein [Saprospira grandis]|uniref:PhoH-like protein n=1 Tax=Saprospira grandis (strain Lewin) TaxID=984262 RepID=H6LAC5_SAPGL|nr:PhoH family protein [Saprospira grandis]AFC24410.1 phoh family protein [Saprospira grandis str. Lewin]WBM75878.1 PhoH family protein [Saprospira grandis]
MATSEILFILENVELIDFYGQNDSKLALLQASYPDLKITPRGNTVRISGEKQRVQEVKHKLELMVKMLQQLGELHPQAIKDMLKGENPFESKLRKVNRNAIVYGRSGKPITPRTRNQKKLVELADINDLVFAIGPAGTGKTYTAVAMAVRALKQNIVKRIILTRPAVEAGENLGFLPGDLKDKIDPYLRPLYDALDDMILPDKLNYFMQNRIIEVAPLAFMRGRTLDDAFVILDEAQNTTEMQLKMFLTRLGPNAKCIITGDLSQIDLPRKQQSGLIRALRILKGVDGIGQLYLDASDVVRHRLVKEIIHAYDRDDAAQESRREDWRRKKEDERNNDPY